MALGGLWQRLIRLKAVRANVRYRAGFHVGPGSVIWAPQALVIGRDVYIGKYCTVQIDGRIGDGTMIANNVGLVGRSDHDMRQLGLPIRRAAWVGDDPRLSRELIIGADVWIGFGAVLLSGITVGDSAVIAAGAVVHKDVPPDTIVAGNPAVPVGRRFGVDAIEQHWEQLRARGYGMTL